MLGNNSRGASSLPHGEAAVRRPTTFICADEEGPDQTAAESRRSRRRHRKPLWRRLRPPEETEGTGVPLLLLTSVS